MKRALLLVLLLGGCVHNDPCYNAYVAKRPIRLDAYSRADWESHYTTCRMMEAVINSPRPGIVVDVYLH